MADAKHVPGPWAVCTEPPNEMWFAGRTIGAANPSDARRICDLPVLAHPTINAANGRLIAAAPELLEAAKAAWNCICELSPTQARVETAQLLQAAIEKATGATA